MVTSFWVGGGRSKLFCCFSYHNHGSWRNGFRQDEVVFSTNRASFHRSMMGIYGKKGFAARNWEKRMFGVPCHQNTWICVFFVVFP